MPTENRSTPLVSPMESALAEFLRGKMKRLRNSYTRAFEAGWQARDADRPTEQHQGVPVAVLYASGEVLTKADCGDAFATCCKVETPLYTHADPNVRWKAVTDEQMKVIENLRADLASANADKEAYAQNAIDLRAQLAERDALLHEVSISPDWSLSVDLQVRISNALSASAEPGDECAHSEGNKDGCPECGETFAGAEPSAPIERDEQAAFKAHFADYLAGANKLGTSYNNIVARGMEIGWMARAGVPGKPSQP